VPQKLHDCREGDVSLTCRKGAAPFRFSAIFSSKFVCYSAVNVFQNTVA